MAHVGFRHMALDVFIYRDRQLIAARLVSETDISTTENAG